MCRTIIAFITAGLLVLGTPGSTVAGPVLKRAGACFIVGNATLPSDVVVDTAVTCDASAAQPFAGVPEVALNGVTYSSIDFQQDQSVSPVGFALQKFATPDDPTTADLATFTTNNALYGAVNAGLRSLGSDAPTGALAKLKGPGFFLGFQLARINQDNGVEGISHKLSKVLKNCAGCSDADRQAVNALAQSSGVNTTGLS